MNVIRSFIAFDLPEEILESIRDVQEQVKKRGVKLKWVPVKNIHLTMKFIGDIQVDLVDKVANMMAESVEGFDAITLSANGMGVFPGLHRPKVLWIGMDGEVDRLDRLQKALDKKLSLIGIQAEKRPFTGHLTIGRAKENLNMVSLKESLRLFYDFQTRPFKINEMKLFQSELLPTGAVYSCIKSVVLSKETEL
ncbi:MAG: RNA 2',3'-cyclic phosphodiesterase [Deltaproteobacteria bacterium]|nr:MAG: RNA 2',3'-cyclic phosphodiesterase [Deltaproteobacteria bacterium]